MADPCLSCYDTCHLCKGKKQKWQWDVMKYSWCHVCGGTGQVWRSSYCNRSNCKAWSKYIETVEYKKSLPTIKIMCRRCNRAYIMVSENNKSREYLCSTCEREEHDETLRREEEKIKEKGRKLTKGYRCVCGRELNEEDYVEFYWMSDDKRNPHFMCRSCGRQGETINELRKSQTWDEIKKQRETAKSSSNLSELVRLRDSSNDYETISAAENSIRSQAVYSKYYCSKCGGRGVVWDNEKAGNKHCDSCGGTGQINAHDTIPCSKCGGSGEIETWFRDPDTGLKSKTCSRCDGRGWFRR